MDSACCFSLSGKNRSHSRNKKGTSPGIPESICRRFSLAEIERATGGFHPDKIIGDGGFGTVYKGCLDDGNTQVAIKRWNRRTSYLCRSESWKEAELCSQLRHPNLVAFKGFCDEHDELIRVYEYMSNGTLEHRLFGRGRAAKDPLSWKQRLRICIDAARGLHYLHSGIKQTIVHRNLNIRNILLGEDCVGKLNDLGLSKVCKGLGRQYSNVRGGSGYAAEPEYKVTGEMTEKTDVYSFGVMLLEVLSGRSSFDGGFGTPDLVRWVCECRENGSIDEVVDCDVKGQVAAECLRMFVEIAESCAVRDRMDRPAMGEVLVELEDVLELQETADLKGMRITI